MVRFGNALTLAFPDLGKQGSLGSLVVSAQPYLASLEGVAPFSNDTPFHIEGFYKYQLTDKISLHLDSSSSQLRIQMRATKILLLVLSEPLSL